MGGEPAIQRSCERCGNSFMVRFPSDRKRYCSRSCINENPPKRAPSARAGQCSLCDEPAYIRGWCVKHHSRWRRHGDPLAYMPHLPSPEEKFAASHEVAASGCWLWTGRLNKDGYGALAAAGQRWPAHVWSYIRFAGPVPDGLEIDHVCHSRDKTCPGNECIHRRCVNPDHLEAVTHRENVRRGVGPAAAKAAQVTCIRNHPLPEPDKNGRRRCLACNRAYKKAQRENVVAGADGSRPASAA